MKYVRTFESFRENKSNKVEPVNEEILGLLKNMFGGLFKKAKELINKTKGGNEVEDIYKKYLKMIKDEFSKQAQVDLNITAAGEGKKEDEPKDKTPQKDVEKSTEKEAVAESKIFEADEAVDAKLDPAKLKEKKAVLDQILKKMKDMAIKEMDAVLKKYGGSSSNPKLAIIINAKKDQFELDVLNSQIEFLNKAGDKTLIPEITKQRDAVAKKVESTLKEAENVKSTGKLVTLNWGDAEIEIELPVEGASRYKIIKSSSKKLTLDKGELFCDINGEVKKGESIKLENITIAGKGSEKFEIDGNNFYETGKIEKITFDNKDVDSYKFNETAAKEENTEIKEGDTIEYKSDKDETKTYTNKVKSVSGDEVEIETKESGIIKRKISDVKKIESE